MQAIIDGIRQAITLLLQGDPQVVEITLLSLQVSVSAVLISMLLGMPLGVMLALNRFPGRSLVVSAVNAGMGVPPVVAGLAVFLVIARSGPLGDMHIVYTPAAMVIAQVVIALPIVAGLTMSAIQQLPPKLRLQTLGLGASRTQMVVRLLKESRLPLLAAVMAGFGGVISEIGAVLMVGGNIKDQTRVLTTATVQMTRMGRLDMAIALSVILMALIFGVNLVLTWIQQSGKTE
ncbi:MAG: ABC transporter permease subunit [Actinobacteria bacterium]|nr:MAG: ABC transporter permease subunit [Actinomycetota bacterium]